MNSIEWTKGQFGADDFRIDRGDQRPVTGALWTPRQATVETPMVAKLFETPGVRLVEPLGAFYAFPDVSELMEKKGIATSLDLASVLLDEAEIAVVPGDAFGAPGFVRFSFALADEDLETGLTRFQEWAS